MPIDPALGSHEGPGQYDDSLTVDLRYQAVGYCSGFALLHDRLEVVPVRDVADTTLPRCRSAL